jgi:2-polyprenyl-6-methoxyphenol hydroxylase-like FAD-dependent oxidoreductase
MTRIVVIGAGLSGLAAALLLARDGHEVTVLERDPAEPEGDAEALWRNWERPGVSQFRLPHGMIAYWRRLMERELPEVIDEVERLGGRRESPIDTMPAALTGGLRAGDEDLRGMSARRPVLEGALAAVAARTPGLTIRRGAKTVALVTVPRVGSDGGGVPQVGGVVIDTGETLAADLVVDAMGRTTSLDRMLDAIGARKPDDQTEEFGYVYYGRQFRNNEPRSVTATTSVVPYEGMTLLTLVGDADTYSLVFYTASTDRALRGLRDVDAWERALAMFPDVRPLRSVSTPTTGIQVMAGDADRRRSFLVDGAPVVTGLVAVGDAAVRTNPSLGRGGATGLAQACTLRDVLREVGPDRPDELALRFARAVEAVIGPLYRLTIDFDRNRMAEIQADITGTPHRFTDATWNLQRALLRLVRQDADALRIVLRANLHIEPLDPTRFPASLRDEIEALDVHTPPYPPDGPTRAQLIEAVTGRSQQSVA